jgi:hypothetical protein
MYLKKQNQLLDAYKTWAEIIKTQRAERRKKENRKKRKMTPPL